jgi:hypothetical protein
MRALIILASSVFLLAGGPSLLAAGEVVELTPQQDNTLYQDAGNNGLISNGAGQHFFCGRISTGFLRRGLVQFDVAGGVPRGATVTKARLRLHLSRSLGFDTTVDLHRVLASWGEGASDADDPEGQGAPAEEGDATWRYRFFDTVEWSERGGDFDETISASADVGDVGLYTWESQQLVIDVQDWLDDPGSNFGWMVRGDEVTHGSAKRFDTRENPNPDNRPRLTIEYEGGCKGDVDGDGSTCLSDLAALLAAFGTCEGDPGYNPDANLVRDGESERCIDLADLALLLSDFGCGGCS